MTQEVGMVTETRYLFRLNYSLEVPYTYGTEGFDDRLYPDKVFYGTDIPPTGKPTLATTTISYRVVSQGTPEEIFKGIDEDRLRWGSSQVAVFGRHHFEFISTTGGIALFELDDRLIMLRKLNATGLMLRAPYLKSNQILKPPAGGMRIFFLTS